MVRCSPATGKYMACSLLFRGDVTPSEVVTSMPSVRNMRTVNFVDWCPTGFKVNINSKPPLNLERELEYRRQKRSCCLISNSSSVRDVFMNLCFKFDIMFEKRAFMHWFYG